MRRAPASRANSRKPASGPRPGVTRLPDRAADVKCPPRDPGGSLDAQWGIPALRRSTPHGIGEH
eukprot:3476815-Alexandrium_andersonii.AAC.1